MILEVNMKKKNLDPRAGKILLAIGCLLLAIVFWFVVKYGQIETFSLFSAGLG